MKSFRAVFFLLIIAFSSNAYSVYVDPPSVPIVPGDPEICMLLMEECQENFRLEGCDLYSGDERCNTYPHAGTSSYENFLVAYPYVDSICNEWSADYDIDPIGCRVMCSEAIYQAAMMDNYAAPQTLRDNYPLYCESLCGRGQYAEYIDYRLGTNYTGTSSAKCKSCPGGTYMSIASGHNNTSCITCGAGTVSSPGASICRQCSSGTYAEAGWSSCKYCPENTYSMGAVGSCTPCPEPGIYPAEGGDGIEVCYIPKDVEIEDDTGTYVYSSDCWWSME